MVNFVRTLSDLKNIFKLTFPDFRSPHKLKAGYTQPGAGTYSSQILSLLMREEAGFPHGKTSLCKSNQGDPWWNDGSAIGSVWEGHQHWHSLGAPLPLISFAWPFPPLPLPLLRAVHLTLWVTSRMTFMHHYSGRAAGDRCELCRQDGVAVCRLMAGKDHNLTSLPCFIWGIKQSPSCHCLAFSALFWRLL